MHIRKYACELLENYDRQEALGLLGAGFEKYDSDIKTDIIITIGKLKVSGALPLLLSEFKDRRKAVKKAGSMCE